MAEFRAELRKVSDGLERLNQSLARQPEAIAAERARLESRPALLSIVEAAKELNVSPKTVRKMISAHRLPAVNIERRVLVPLAAIKEAATPYETPHTKRRQRRISATKATEGELEKLAAARLARRAAR